MADLTFEDYESLPWVEVESSNLRRVAWVVPGVDPDAWPEQESGELTVEFHGDRAYVYRDVHRETYEELVEADSVGSYFNRVVKGEHHYEPISVVTR